LQRNKCAHSREQIGESIEQEAYGTWHNKVSVKEERGRIAKVDKQSAVSKEQSYGTSAPRMVSSSKERGVLRMTSDSLHGSAPMKAVKRHMGRRQSTW
jgi:hypothetical protein